MEAIKPVKTLVEKSREQKGQVEQAGKMKQFKLKKYRLYLLWLHRTNNSIL